jgi:2-methylcitrate dehydratase PrpD
MLATERIGSWATSLRYEDLPEAIVERAKLHVLDTLGCGLAAFDLGEGGAAASLVADEGASNGLATIIGRSDRTSAAEAALANGMLCSSLDYDDTHPRALCHISAVAVPSALALAEAKGLSGRDFIVALTASVETTARLGMAAHGAFHARGLHPTSICGALGATVGAGLLRGLSQSSLVAAVGIAGSTSSGLMEYLADGSATKQFHAGWAAHAAVIASGLAVHGATGPASVVDGRFGLFNALLGEGHRGAIDRQFSDLGERWETLAIAAKPYPACHMTHAAMEGVARLRENGLAFEDVSELLVGVPESAVGIVLEPAKRKLAPSTPYEAKFSLAFCAASMLVHGQVGPRTYTEAALKDTAVLDVASRIRYSIRKSDARGPLFAAVTATLADGSERYVEVDYPKGSPEAPLPRSFILDKFRANATPVLGAAAANRLLDLVLRLDDLDEVSGWPLGA